MNKEKIIKFEENSCKLIIYLIMLVNFAFGIIPNLDEKFAKVINLIFQNKELVEDSDVDKIILKCSSAVLIFLCLEILKSLKFENKKSLPLKKMLKKELGENSCIKRLSIFAFSGCNYIDYIQERNVKIDTLELLLKRYNAKQAYLTNDKNVISGYKSELFGVIRKVVKLKKVKQIKKVEIRFFDFEPYSHFAIINENKVIAGNLIHTFDESKVDKSHVKVFDYSNDSEFFSSYQEFFARHFESSNEYSGLNNYLDDDCQTCCVVSQIQKGGTSNSFFENTEVCNFAVLADDLLGDFLLIPDMLPLSEYHLLLITNFHILSLFQYLKFNSNPETVEDLITKLDRKIYDYTNKHIIVFEHGSNFENSKLSGKSIDHFHLHILLNDGIDMNAEIAKDSQEVVNLKDHNSLEEFDSLKEFSQCEKAGLRDYFLIWDPSAQDKKISVYFPCKKESQYLRRIYFSTLEDAKKISLGLAQSKKSKSFKNGYDWRLNPSSFSVDKKKQYIEFGKKLKENW